MTIKYFMTYYFRSFLEVTTNIFMLAFTFTEVPICGSLPSILGINSVACCMNTRVREMALNKGTPEGAAIRDVVDTLRKHQAVLPSLPEILERLISNETSETNNFDMSRYAFECSCLLTAVLFRRRSIDPLVTRYYYFTLVSCCKHRGKAPMSNN